MCRLIRVWSIAYLVGVLLDDCTVTSNSVIPPSTSLSGITTLSDEANVTFSGDLFTTVEATMVPITDDITDASQKFENVTSLFNSSECTFAVDPISIDDFLFHARTDKFNFVYFKFSFTNTEEIYETENVFRPYNWAWTFRTDAGVEPFLHWPHAYGVLSLGVLDSFTINLDIKFHVEPKNCKIELGNMTTTKRIAVAFGDMLTEHLSKVRQDYNQTIWCHEEIYPTWIQLPDALAHTIGVDNKDVGYRCCRQKFDTVTRLRSSFCYDTLYIDAFLTTTLHYILALIGLLYCPIWFCNCGHNMSPISTPRTSEEIARRSTIHFKLADDVTWLYLGTRSPVTLSSMFTRTFGYLNHSSQVRDRLLRVAFVLLSPALIYIRLALFYNMQHDYLRDAVDKRLPVGFLSVLFGFQASHRTMFYLLGGPYVVYGIYLVVGSVLLCLPGSFSRLMSDILLVPVTKVFTPLKLDLADMEKLGGFSCLRKRNYKLILNAMKANVFMTLNPQFWKMSFEIQIHRVLDFRKVCAKLPETFTKVVFCLSAAVYIPLCITELVLCVLYYTFPILFFAVLITRSYLHLFSGVIDSLSFLNRSRTISKVAHIVTACFTIILVMYILYAFCTLFVASLAFLIGVLTFFYIGVVAYPSIAVGYFMFALTSCYYIWKTIRDIDMGYMELFKTTINVSKTLSDEKLIPPPSNRNGQTETSLQTNFTQTGTSLTSPDVSVLCPFVRNCDGRQGIPRDLFEMVIRKHRPFRVHVLISLLKLVAVSAFIITSIRVINNFNKFHEIHLIYSLASALLICSIPRLLSVISVDDKLAADDEFKRRLGKTISEYWRQKDRRQLNSGCPVFQMQVQDQSEVV